MGDVTREKDWKREPKEGHSESNKTITLSTTYEGVMIFFILEVRKGGAETGGRAQ